MLYTKGFMLAGVLALAVTVAACANAAETEAARQPRPAPLRLGALLDPSDIEALSALSAALATHTVLRHELTEPDHVIAAHARAAAQVSSEQTGATLLSLAESAQRSALAFLVDYHLAAGGWEAEAGLRMGAPALERR